MVTVTLHLNADSYCDFIKEHYDLAKLIDVVIHSDVCLYWENQTVVEEAER